MLPMLGRRAFTLRRYDAGGDVTWVDGEPVKPAAVDSVISGSVQPLTKDDVQRLPEGYRIDKWRKVFTDVRLHSLDQVGSIESDQLVIDGVVYTVNLTDPWVPVAPLPHYESLVVRVKE